jgi:AraC-like DNA-binding protein
MAIIPSEVQAQLSAVPLPLRSIGVEIETSPDRLATVGQPALGQHEVWTNCPREDGLTQFMIIRLGEIVAITGRTTPMAMALENSGKTTVSCCYAGNWTYRIGASTTVIHPGEVLCEPSIGGQAEVNLSSGILFQIDNSRLMHTLETMTGTPAKPSLLEASLAIRKAKSLFSLFHFLDSILAEDRHLGSMLGFDEQIYRLIALAHLEREGIGYSPPKFSPSQPRWSACLDELVDFIRANSDHQITLTDLEAQSHYSGRHLQNLFREKFDCTPMQFVRRQRLAIAMNRLQAASDNASISQIARDCGYAHAANFTVDFKIEFGQTPSAVRKAARPQISS